MGIEYNFKIVQKTFTTTVFIELQMWFKGQQSDQHNCSRVHITVTPRGLTWMVFSSLEKPLVHHRQGIKDFCWVRFI